MLVLVRHGESEGNADGLLVGRMETPLTARGRHQARALRPAVAGATRLICSPLGRARQTAEALGLAVAAEIDDRWIELDYGELDGTPLGAVPVETWRRWRGDSAFAPAGGESLADLGRRVRSACDELFADDGAGARAVGDVVVVSHVSPIKAAVAWALGAADDVAWRLHLATGSVTRIGWGPSGPVLDLFNGTPPGAGEPAPDQTGASTARAGSRAGGRLS